MAELVLLQFYRFSFYLFFYFDCLFVLLLYNVKGTVHPKMIIFSPLSCLSISYDHFNFSNTNILDVKRKDDS